MASSASSPEKDPRDAISIDGYFKCEDAALGRCVQRMDDDGIAFASRRGLQFCKDNVLDHQRIQPILKASFEWSALGLYRSIGPAPDVYTFESAPDFDMQILIIMVWNKESRCHFWPGSHRHWLFPVDAANSLLAVSRHHLRRLGLQSKEEKLAKGGL
jgi:hypothetical protein